MRLLRRDVGLLLSADQRRASVKLAGARWEGRESGVYDGFPLFGDEEPFDARQLGAVFAVDGGPFLDAEPEPSATMDGTAMMRGTKKPDQKLAPDTAELDLDDTGRFLAEVDAILEERIPKPIVGIRRSRRYPVDIPVTLEAPSVSDTGWVVQAVDINVDGMGLKLPAEIGTGLLILLSCHLDRDASFTRLPGKVVRVVGGKGGVRFLAWSEEERLMLAEYLLRREEARVRGR